MSLRSICRPWHLFFKTRNLSLSPNFNSFRIFPLKLESMKFPAKVTFAASKGCKVRDMHTSNVRSTSTFASPSSSVETALPDNGSAVELLTGADDTHGGVIVDMKTRMDSASFVSSLRASMLRWRQEGKKGVWIKLPIELVHLVQAAVKEGFWYHHAEPKYLMLVYWIPETVHTLPVNASHRVGVGGVVMNDKREVLLVQEKSGMLRGKALWKFPTGVVNEGEDIFAGVVREVKEETGIDTEFVEILAFRQSHESFFEKSDLFFVCMLRPLSFDIQKQELEIEEAKWMPLEEYVAQPSVQKHDLLKYIVNICLAKTQGEYAGFSPVCIKSGFSDKQSYFYLNEKYINQPLSSGNQS